MNIKKILLICVTTLFTLLALNSCNSNSERANYIPGDALIVVNLDMKSLWNKCDFSNINNISFVKLGLQELREDEPAFGKIVDDIIKDPISSGLNLKNDITFFANDRYGVIVASMHNMSKFEEKLNDLARENDIKLHFEKKDGYKKAILDDLYFFYYNKEVAYFEVSNLANGFDDFLNDKKSKTLADNKKFKEYWKTRTELSLWLDFGAFIDLADYKNSAELLDEYFGISKDYLDALHDGCLVCNLAFDDGCIRLTSDMPGVDTKYVKEFTKAFNKELLGSLPEKSYALVTLAMNPEFMEHYLETLSRNDDIDLDEEIIDNVTIRDILHIFNGSVAFSLFDFDEMKEMPFMAIVADIKNDSDIKQILARLNLTMENGYYKIPESEFDGELYIAVKDKKAIFTNSYSAIKDFTNGTAKGINIKPKSDNYAYADLDINNYPIALTSNIPEKICKLLAQYSDYTEIKSDGYKGEWTVYLKNKKENSLLFTLHFIDDNLMSIKNIAENIDDNDDYYLLEDDDDYMMEPFEYAE